MPERRLRSASQRLARRLDLRQSIHDGRYHGHHRPRPHDHHEQHRLHGGSSSTDGGSSTGDPLCGNGLIDPGEDCDDGDGIQGNGCNNDCVASGEELWTQTYAGPDGANDVAKAVAVDSTDAVIVVGWRGVAGAGSDVLVRKYDSNGALVWERSYDGAGNAADGAYGVAVDSLDNVIVVGEERNAALERLIWVRKYDTDGNPLWTQNEGGPFSNANAQAVSVDSTDAIAVAGLVVAAAEGQNYWLRKYDPDGGTLWTLTQDLAAGGLDMADSVATDGNDHVIAVGINNSLPGTSGFAYGYDDGGALLWGGALVGAHLVTAVDVNAADEAFVTSTQNGLARLDKLSPQGAPMWNQTYQPAGGLAGLDAVAVDSTGAITICGWQYDGVTHRILVRKYGADAVPHWTRTYEDADPGSGVEYGWGIATDSVDNLIVVGQEDVGGQLDWWIRKYTP